MKSNSPTLTKSSTLSSPISLLSSSPAASASSSSSSSSSLSSSSYSPSSSSFSPFTMRQILISLALLLTTVTLSQACFIRNCPKGGKRAFDGTTIAMRPCIGCGPGNSGQCVGPQICCSPEFGCHMGKGHADVCQAENESTTPCFVKGNVCGPRDSGKCVADGVCCDSETCTMADSCNIGVQSSKRDQDKVLKLLERLLKTKSD